MTQIIHYYVEPLDIGELRFLQKKEQHDRKQLYKVVRILLFLSFIIPFIVAWFRALNGAPNPFSYLGYFVTVIVLLGISGIGLYFAYRSSLQMVRRDVHRRTKTIEQTHITRKQYMPQNNTWYFYLDSPTRLSIEVDEADYNRLREGDELNIEYTTYAKLHLGYF
jgi:hypothetical protein